MTEPIICTGNELVDTLRGLRERGLFPWALDTTVGTNASYRINYYALNQTVAGDGTSRGECKPKSVRRPDEVTSNPATNNFERVGGVPNDTVESHPERVAGAKAAALAPFSPSTSAAMPRDNPRMAKSVERCTARKPVHVNAESNDRSANSGEKVGRDSRRDGISIEERMAALRDRLASTGKLKRSRYSTPAEYARQPHKND